MPPDADEDLAPGHRAIVQCMATDAVAAALPAIGLSIKASLAAAGPSPNAELLEKALLTAALREMERQHIQAMPLRITLSQHRAIGS